MSTNSIDLLLMDGGGDETLDTFCMELVSGLELKEKTFLNIVEDLEGLLTSPDLKKHIVGLDVLENVIKLLPKDILTVAEYDFVTNFFCAQVKQHHSFVSTALKALLSLVQVDQLSKESLHNVTSTLFGNVVWQTQTLSDRKVFYEILQFIVVNRIKDYKTTSSEFLFNVISCIDGERDPRNILILFSFLPMLYSSIPLGALVEDAFEAVACYFPVDFNSSSSDPGTVTRNDLVAALIPCMLAVPEFTALCINLIEEKLESSLKSAKIDSYILIGEGCKLWSPDVVEAHLEGLWRSIRQDTLPPRDTQVADSAILAMQALVKVLPNESRTALLTSLLDSCEGFLSNVQLTLFEPSSRLLLAAMQASDLACEYLTYKLLPGFISLLQVTQENTKILVLDKLISFIKVCLQNILDFNSGGDVWQKLFAELIECSQRSTLSVDAQQSAYIALTLVAEHLDIESRRSLYSCLLTHATSLQPSPLRIDCMKCLQALALNYGEEVQLNIVDGLELNHGVEDLKRTQNKFETVCSLAVVERFQPLLEQQFLFLVSHGLSATSITLSCLRNLLEREEVQMNHNFMKFLCCQSSLLPSLCDLESDSREDLLNAAKIIQILIRLQDAEQQAKVGGPLAKRLLQHPNSTNRLILLESLLGPLWPEVSILTANEVNQVVIPAIIGPLDDNLSQKAVFQLLAFLINKANDDHLLDSASEALKLCSASLATTAHAYITKALVLRSHPLMDHWVNKLVDLLDKEDVGEAAAEGIHLIVSESQEFLSHQNHCLVKLLYRQRLFHLIVPRLVKSASKVHHLKAMAYLLQAVPHTVYVHYIKEIMPLLVRSLDTECESLLCTVLHTIVSLLSTNHSALEDHVDTFVPRFLHLSRHSMLMKVRIAALQCLSNSLKFSTPLLLPHKQQVITELVYCLDDKKRLVRKEAARTRSKWFLLGSPTTDT